jgi:V-type H+-transporting ATPase subunit H
MHARAIWAKLENQHLSAVVAPVQHISAFVDWLIGQLKRPSNPSKSIPTATSVLALLLKERGTRQLFLRAGGVQLLAPLLKSSNSPSNSQLLYELCLCAWQMSFVHAAAEAMGKAGEGSMRACRGAQMQAAVTSSLQK